MENNLLSTINLENNASYYHVWRGEPALADQVQKQKDYYTVCLVLKGQLLHQHNQEQYVLSAGDCFIVPPGFVHSVEAVSDETVCFWLVFQSPRAALGRFHKNIQNLLSSLSMENDLTAENHQMKIILPKTEQENLCRLFECLMYECFSVTEDENNVLILIASILSAISRNYFNNPALEKTLKQIDEYDAIMLECMRYIDENYMKPLTISFMAKQFAISSSHFSLMFPKIAGAPFKQYLNHKRISAAVALCADQTLSFGKIAEMCGFLDTSTFYRNFIKHMGLSPSSFRMQLQDSSSQKTDK